MTMSYQRGFPQPRGDTLSRQGKMSHKPLSWRVDSFKLQIHEHERSNASKFKHILSQLMSSACLNLNCVVSSDTQVKEATKLKISQHIELQPFNELKHWRL
jgi:hypothetical protein